MARISYGMYYEVYGRNEIDLPDDIDPHDEFAVLKYLEDIKEDLPLPKNAEYIQGSDGIDYDSIFIVRV